MKFIEVENNKYELINNYKDGFDLNEFTSHYTDFFSDYSIGTDILRTVCKIPWCYGQYSYLCQRVYWNHCTFRFCLLIIIFV